MIPYKEIETKECKACKQIRLKNEFSQMRISITGFHDNCKMCEASRDENPNYWKEYSNNSKFLDRDIARTLRYIGILLEYRKENPKPQLYTQPKRKLKKPRPRLKRNRKPQYKKPLEISDARKISINMGFNIFQMKNGVEVGRFRGILDASNKTETPLETITESFLTGVEINGFTWENI